MSPEKRAKLLAAWRQDLAAMARPGALLETEVSALFYGQSYDLRRRIMYRLVQLGWLQKEIAWIFGITVNDVCSALATHRDVLELRKQHRDRSRSRDENRNSHANQR